MIYRGSIRHGARRGGAERQAKYGIIRMERAMNERILIIEDDRLASNCSSGDGCRRLYRRHCNHGRNNILPVTTLDLVIWMMLPGMDGLEVCHRLRTGGSIPILMLTAKDTVQDRIQGLDAGADDYMIKPFNLDELLARVRALLRRTQPERVPVLKFADLTLDTGSRQASRGSRLVPLTMEYNCRTVHAPSKQVLARE
jgi:two-component system response regulator MprA